MTVVAHPVDGDSHGGYVFRYRAYGCSPVRVVSITILWTLSRQYLAWRS